MLCYSLELAKLLPGQVLEHGEAGDEGRPDVGAEPGPYTIHYQGVFKGLM